MSERGADFDAKSEAYEAAREERDRLINDFDRDTPIAEYRAQIKAAHKSVAATHKAMMAAWA